MSLARDILEAESPRAFMKRLPIHQLERLGVWKVRRTPRMPDPDDDSGDAWAHL